MWIFWLILSGFFCFGDDNSWFLVLWLGIGALLAMITSFITDNIFIQTLVFVVSSIILIFFTKPLIKKFLKKETPLLTNAYSIIGQRGIVIKEIPNNEKMGIVSIDGEEWSAKSDDNSVIPVGAHVEVVKIDGVKAIVKNCSSTYNLKEEV